MPGPTRFTFGCLTLVTLIACGSPTAPNGLTFDFDFAEGMQGWTAGFSDYPHGREEDVAFIGEHRRLPAPLDTRRGSLYHEGMNISDDLFMFFTRRVDGLTAGASYRVHMEVEIASHYGGECEGGTASEVWVKAGAAEIEPRADVIDAFGDVRMNIDKGQQENNGANAVILGDVRNRLPTCHDSPYGLKKMTMASPLQIGADASGALWLLVATESGFESPHRLYFPRVRARLEPMAS